MASTLSECSTQKTFKVEPTEFQRQILALSLDEFRSRTNIQALIREEAMRLKNNHDLSDAKVEEYTAHYHKGLHKVHKWQNCALKNLQLMPTVSPVERPIRQQNTAKNVTQVRNHLSEYDSCKQNLICFCF